VSSVIESFVDVSVLVRRRRLEGAGFVVGVSAALLGLRFRFDWCLGVLGGVLLGMG
jgi:hypothetical protein